MFERKLFKHQEALINSVRYHPEIPYVFLIGGYGCGKSASDTYLMLFLYHAYKNNQDPVTFGVIGVTIKLLVQTVIKDFLAACDMSGIPARYNQMTGILTVGNGKVTFVCLPMSNPEDIFAYNFNGVICDEIDEVPPERVLEIVKAIQERNRVVSAPGRDMPAREPWVTFTTTAQGMGGTYQLVQSFRDKNIPHIVIRGRTQDNTSLAPSQIRLLRALYTPEEARAYLDGEFVNLTSGRVYSEYDPSKHIYMPFDVVDDDVIYAGQDFNPGFNTTICLIERAGNIFVVSEDQFGYVGGVPRELRSRYPNNKIVLIPDASGKEILEGYAQELTESNVEVFWNAVNPPITERILGVNRLFRNNRLFIFQDCKKLQNGMLLRDFDDTGKPRKGKGKDALDHGCDSLEYGIWRIIHSIQGYQAILDAIRAVHHHNEILKEAA